MVKKLICQSTSNENFIIFEHSKTILHILCDKKFEENDISMLEEIIRNLNKIKHGNTTYVHIKTTQGFSPAHYAVTKNNLVLYKALDKVIKINNTRSSKEEAMLPIHWAAAGGRFEFIRYIVDKDPESLFEKTHETAEPGNEVALAIARRTKAALKPENTPENTSKYNTLLSIIKHLSFALGKNISLRTTSVPSIPIALEENLTALETALKSGRDPNEMHPRLPPIHLVFFYKKKNYEEYITLLLKYDADINLAENSNGLPPLHYILTRSNTGFNLHEIVKFLLNHGANPRLFTKDKKNALHLIFKKLIHSNNIKETIRLLLYHYQKDPEKFQSFINAQENEYGDTPLHKLAFSDIQGDVLNMLLELPPPMVKKIIWNNRNHLNQTPFHVAILKKNKAVIRILLEKCGVVPDKKAEKYIENIQDATIRDEIQNLVNTYSRNQHKLTDTQVTETADKSNVTMQRGDQKQEETIRMLEQQTENLQKQLTEANTNYNKLLMERDRLSEEIKDKDKTIKQLQQQPDQEPLDLNEQDNTNDEIEELRKEINRLKEENDKLQQQVKNFIERAAEFREKHAQRQQRFTINQTPETTAASILSTLSVTNTNTISQKRKPQLTTPLDEKKAKNARNTT